MHLHDRADNCHLCNLPYAAAHRNFCGAKLSLYNKQFSWLYFCGSPILGARDLVKVTYLQELVQVLTTKDLAVTVEDAGKNGTTAASQSSNRLEVILNKNSVCMAGNNVRN